MSNLKEYTVKIGRREHVLRLSDEDAARYGDAATPVTEPKSASTRTKAGAAPENKGA